MQFEGKPPSLSHMILPHTKHDPRNLWRVA